jgi:CDP-diacylglycerol--serine O-phosphatidyltransferase
MRGPDLSVIPGRGRRRIPPLRNGVYLLPNLVTSAGLGLGFYAIIATLSAQYRQAAMAILGAAVCDMLDGRIARMTRSASSFGVQYDSLADVIAFGVAPGILVHTWALRSWGRWGWLAATLYVTCGALRLARFNVQVGTVEKRHFVGLPIPAAALVIASTVILFYHVGGQGNLPTKRLTMLLVIYAVALLMVSEIRYLSFKDMQLHRRHPFPVLLGLIFVAMVTVGAPEVMLFLGVTSYALSGPVSAVVRAIGRRRRLPPAESRPPAVLDKPGSHG